MSDKPTKILREPYFVESIDVLGRKRKKVRIDTDAGPFSFEDLAAVIGISTDTLRCRMYRSGGWKSAKVLATSRINGAKLRDPDIWKKEHGTSEWRQLGDKPRTHNLALIRP